MIGLYSGPKLEPGVRVLIIGNHPASGSSGTIREVQQVQSLFGGGTGYAVEVDGMAGHQVGCRVHELMVTKQPKPTVTRKVKRR